MTSKPKDLKLVLLTDRFTNENGDTYTGYGFAAYEADPLREVFRIDDLSDNVDDVRELMRLILDHDVCVTHFQDLIEDFCV